MRMSGNAVVVLSLRECVVWLSVYISNLKLPLSLLAAHFTAHATFAVYRLQNEGKRKRERESATPAQTTARVALKSGQRLVSRIWRVLRSGLNLR